VRRGVPKRPILATGLAALALVLLLSFQTPDRLEAQTRSRTGRTPAPIPSTAQAKTVSGPVVNTRWGPVQVKVTIEGRKITAITALQLPAGGRSGRISQRVEPILRSEVLAAQGAAIDNVSGATYTTNAYAQSLQAALDGAGG
jgi:uncharacterized protein with FMN-binding domain